MFCDPNTPLDYNPIVDTVNPCEPVVQFISQLACPAMSVNQVFGYLQAYEAYFGIFLLVGGGLMCFFGIKMFGPTVCLIGFLTSIVVALVFFWAVYASATTQPKEFLYWLGGGAIAGIVIGCILCKNQKAGAAMAAGWGGAIAGAMLN